MADDEIRKDIDFRQALARLKNSPVEKASESDVFKNITGKQGMKTMKGSDFTEKIAKLKALRKLGKGLKAVGPVGAIAGLGASLASGDAAAAAADFAVPGGMEDIGPEEGSVERKLEMGEPLSAEERQQLNQQYKRQALSDKLGRQ